MQPTPAQHALKQSAVAGGITALATIAAGTYQYVLGNGLNIPALLLFLAPFITGQALTLWHTLRSLPQFPQALADTVLDLPQEIKTLPALVAAAHQRIDALFAAQHTHQAPPTAIGQSAMPQTSVALLPFVTPANASAAPVPQQAFPAQPGASLPWSQVLPAVQPK